ncbi:MAG TPA: LLM class flavin-dependent oxidoreductase [Thermomicrobiaceae bacterium]|nr:LLM class flavin-dependent oxidoreductase [Thermomicrobiaceae bacterium]
MELPTVGMDLVDKRNARSALEAAKRAAARGVPMVWSTTGPSAPDPMSFFGAVAVETDRLGFGTAIVPTYPRHPTVIATQALALDQLAPGRFRLGLGPSHQPTITGALGLPMGRPLDHLREYVTITRDLLWNGQSDFEGQYYQVHSRMIGTAQVPIYISALRSRAFRLAGEVADGAISWMCPLGYIRDVACAAMRQGAALAGRPMPRMVAHIPVVMTGDRARMIELARPRVSGYARLPFYAAMFADAGYPVGDEARVSDELLDRLVVWGDESEVRRRLSDALGQGVDELLLTLLLGDAPEKDEQALSRVLADLSGAHS